MPNYDYKCEKCSHIFEIFQSMTAAQIKKCPECGGKVKRLIGPGAGIIFKGSGFYATDYKKGGKKPKDKKDTNEKIPDQCKKCKKDNCEIKE